MNSLADEIVQMVLGPALQKKRLSEPVVLYERYLGCYQEVFEIGAVLGHAFRNKFIWFVQFFSNPGREAEVGTQLRLVAQEHLDAAEDGRTFFGLAMRYEESRFQKNWHRAGYDQLQIEHLTKNHELTRQQAFGMLRTALILGVGFGGTFPELTEEMWRDAYERPKDRHLLELLRGSGLSGPPPELLPLANQQALLLSGVRLFVGRNHPDLISEFEAAVG